MAAEEAADESLLSFDVRSLSGESVGLASVGAAALARELVEQVRALLGNPRGVVRLLCETRTLAESVPVAQQVPPGAGIQCLVVPVGEEQQQQVAQSVLRGEALGEDGWQVWDCVESLEDVSHVRDLTLPSALQHITFASLRQSLDGVVFPAGLQTISFGHRFNQSLARVVLPAGLRSIHFGVCFNQSLAGVALPGALQSIHFGYRFNQSLAGIALPAELQSITFGERFNQGLDGVALPEALQSISFGGRFNQGLDGVALPAGLQNITLGRDFNQSLAGVNLPGGLRRIRLDRRSRLDLGSARLPPGVEVVRG